MRGSRSCGQAQRRPISKARTHGPGWRGRSRQLRSCREGQGFSHAIERITANACASCCGGADVPQCAAGLDTGTVPLSQAPHTAPPPLRRTGRQARASEGSFCAPLKRPLQGLETSVQAERLSIHASSPTSGRFGNYTLRAFWDCAGRREAPRDGGAATGRRTRRISPNE